MDKMSIYNRLPIFAQNLACDFEGGRLARLRYGGDFEERLARYLASASLSKDELASIRNQKLKHLVAFCYKNVPFYSKLFDASGFNPDSLKDERDLLALPILDKGTVRGHADEFRPTDLSLVGECIHEHTSGSTGSSLIFEQSVDNLRDLWAVFWRFWIALGIERDTMCADFGSRTIVPASQTRPPFWRISRPLKQVKFSAFHASGENYAHYAREINDGRLQWIHGYPSCIVPFAAYVLEHGIVFDAPIKWVTTSAENLYDHQRVLIERAFGVQPYSLYALTEATACISESADHDLLVDEEYALVELVPTAGEYCRIVGTNLTNYAFPLIRYDTGDLCTYKSAVVNGRRKVEAIDGRNAELIILPDGGTVGTLSALFTESNTVKEAQIVQHKDLSVTIKYVALGQASGKDIEIARRKFFERTRGLLPVEFVEVASIERTARGKLRYVVSEVEASSNEWR